MDKSLALQLAKRCLPHFEGKGVGKLTEIDSVKPRNLLGLWTGMGSVDEVQVKSKDDSVSFVVKTVGSHKKLDDELALVDHMSYYNEATFYEQNLSDSICAAGALCPKALLVDRTEDGELTICMTKLPGRGFSRNPEQTRQALQWLAKLHALFWGKPADEVVKSGVAERACFWDLSRRQIELRRMPKDVLRHAAKGIDARLQADKMMTMCHGDPKGQFHGECCFAAPMDDLAYFFGVAAHGLSGEETERELLKFYHEELCKLLEAKSISPPNFEYLWNSYHLALCDLGRWMVGGFSFGNTRLIFGHVKALTTTLAGLDSEQACQEKIFKLYPP